MNGRSDVEDVLGGELPEPPVLIIDESDPLDLANWDRLDDVVSTDHGDNVIISFRGAAALAE